MSMEAALQRRHDQLARALQVFDGDPKESVIGILLSWMSVQDVDEMLDWIEQSRNLRYCGDDELGSP